MSWWRHKKSGGAYEEIGRGSVQSAEWLRDLDDVVLYRGQDDRLWVRPVVEFEDRFEAIEAPDSKFGCVKHHLPHPCETCGAQSADEVGYHLSRNNSVAVADDLTYLPMDTCPIGVKVLLLNRGGVAVLGVVRKGELDEWRGWFPLPKERK